MKTPDSAMTLRLKPHLAYRESGIPWLGAVPEHWDVMALRHRYSVELGKMLDAKSITGDYLLPYLRNVDVQWNRISSDNLPSMDIRPDEYERYTVRSGDLLVCEGGEVGRAAVWDGNNQVVGYQKALHRLRPYSPSENPHYLMHLLHYTAQLGVFQSDGSENTIAHLTGVKLRRHRFAFPPLDEQAAIVRFINYIDHRVNRLIRAKRRLIELLNEQKQLTLIGTFKAYRNDPLRSLELRRFVKFISGGTPSKGNMDYWGGEIPWVSPKDMKRNYIGESIDTITEEGRQAAKLHFIPKGSVLVVARGMILARTFPVAITNSIVTINQDMKALVINSDACSSDYLVLSLKAMESTIFSFVDTSGQILSRQVV